MILVHGLKMAAGNEKIKGGNDGHADFEREGGSSSRK